MCILYTCDCSLISRALQHVGDFLAFYLDRGLDTWQHCAKVIHLIQSLCKWSDIRRAVVFATFVLAQSGFDAASLRTTSESWLVVNKAAWCSQALIVVF